MDVPDVPALLRLVNENPDAVPADGPIDVDDAYYYVSDLMVKTGGEVEMAEWRKKLFMVMYRNSASASNHFQLPPDRTVIESSGIRI